MNYYAIVKLNLVGGASEFILDALSLSKNKRIFMFQLLIGKLRTFMIGQQFRKCGIGFNSPLVNCEPKEYYALEFTPCMFQLLIGKLRT